MAKRLNDTAFTDSLNRWLDVLGEDRVVKFISGGGAQLYTLRFLVQPHITLDIKKTFYSCLQALLPKLWLADGPLPMRIFGAQTYDSEEGAFAGILCTLPLPPKVAAILMSPLKLVRSLVVLVAPPQRQLSVHLYHQLKSREIRNILLNMLTAVVSLCSSGSFP